MEYKQASLTADIIVKYFDEILLIKRKNDPYKDHYAFPGGFLNLDDNETFIQAAIRELKEETNIDVSEDRLEFFKLLDDPFRDKRGRIVSVVYLLDIDFIDKEEIDKVAKAGDDAKEIEWVKINKIYSGEIKLAFDHKLAADEIYYGEGEK
jgi:8-oxo-dGTP diphosphatase